MATYQQAHHAKKIVEAELISREGVTGISTGYKIKGGKLTNELAVRVYVAKKRKVAAAQMIPPEIDGVPTDVIQRTYQANVLKLKATDLGLQADTGTYDPLRGGISIGPCRVIDAFVYVGTLGAIVVDNATNQQWMLSNFHVMCVDDAWSVGDTMAQPSRVDGGNCPADVVGQLQRAVLAGNTGAGGPGVDGAVAKITARGNVCDVVDIGDVAGTVAASEGQAVRKRGRTTGLTFGTVESTDLTVNIDYGDGLGPVTLFDQIGIDVDTAQSTQFGIGGDSGSVVMDSSRRVLGLYYGGNVEDVDNAGNVITPEGVFGVANPIQAVLDALDISLCIEKKIEVKQEKPEKSEHKFEKFEKIEKPEHKFEKFEKIEKPEHKFEKFEKIEKREHKFEKFEKSEFEPKVVREPKDFREPKEVLEPKRVLEPKEIREPKGLQEPKGFNEPKGLLEPKQFEVPPGGPDPFDRIARLEAAVEQLSHFISQQLRPDLAGGALRNEPDVSGAMSADKLRKDAKDAKETKDGKDTEKPREG